MSGSRRTKTPREFARRWRAGRSLTNSAHDASRYGQLVSQASTIHVREEKELQLSDDGLFETPFLFMNGHFDFQLSAEEIENLRKYFARGGFVFASVGAGLGSVFDSMDGFSPSAALTPEVIVALFGLAVLSMVPVAYKRFARKPATSGS